MLRSMVEPVHAAGIPVCACAHEHARGCRHTGVSLAHLQAMAGRTHVSSHVLSRICSSVCAGLWAPELGSLTGSFISCCVSGSNSSSGILTCKRANISPFCVHANSSVGQGSQRRLPARVNAGTCVCVCVRVCACVSVCIHIDTNTHTHASVNDGKRCKIHTLERSNASILLSVSSSSAHGAAYA